MPDNEVHWFTPPPETSRRDPLPGSLQTVNNPVPLQEGTVSRSRPQPQCPARPGGVNFAAGAVISMVLVALVHVGVRLCFNQLSPRTDARPAPLTCPLVVEAS